MIMSDFNSAADLFPVTKINYIGMFVQFSIYMDFCNLNMQKNVALLQSKQK